MVYPQKRIAYFQADEYLALEEKAQTKHEYLRGVIYAWQDYGPLAMAGGTLRHNRVTLNIAVGLRALLKGSGCDVFIADVRLNSADKSAYFYPDVIVTCSPADKARDDGVAEPSLVVEVLSDSTEEFDRGDKFDAYKSFASLQSYVLISPERRTIEVYSRDDAWSAQARQQRPDPGTAVDLRCLRLRLSAAEVFDGL